MKRKIFNVLFALVLVLGMSLVMATPVAAATLEVGAGRAYTTITAAIAAASPGDTITVYAETYNAEAAWPIDVNKQLVIQSSAGAATTIIDPGASGQGAIKISAENVTIDGFTVKGGSQAYTADDPQENAIWVLANYATIKNNTIINYRGNQAGIYIGNGQANTPTGAVFGYKPATPANSRLGHTIQDNTFRQVDAGEGWGIFAYDLSDSLIHGNTFVGDAADVGNWVPANEGAPGTGIIIHTATAGVGVTRSPGGGYVVIENNTARYLKYTWLTFYAAYMYTDSVGYGYEQPEASTVDKVTVRNNTVYDCGKDSAFDSGTAVKFHRAKVNDAYGAKGADLTVGTNNVTIGPGNTFYNLDIGVYIDEPKACLVDSDLFACILGADNIIIVNNNIYSTVSYGLANGTIEANQEGGAKTITAETNWWGSASGPTHSGNTFNLGNQGDIVTDSVDYVPWLSGVYLTGTSFAPVKNITDDPDSTFSSIQAAITAATADDVITCAAGTYTEDLTISANLTLESVAGAATTTILTAGSPNDIVLITAAGVTIDGFTIQGDGVAAGAVNGIDVRASGFTIQNNIFVDIYFDNIFLGNSGVAITSGLIDSNNFTGMGTDAAAYRPAINVESGANAISGVTVSNNTVSDYSGVESAGIQVAEVTGAVSAITVSGNTISDSSFGIATWNDPATVTINDNTITGCDVGVDIYGDADPLAPGLTLSENTITGNTDYGIRVRTDAHNLTGAGIVIQYNTISGNSVGVSVACTGTVNSNPVATYNWWGTAAGPYHATTNPGVTAKMGNSVSDHVTYAPWLYLTTVGNSGDTVANIYANEVPAYAKSVVLSSGWNTFSVPIALDGQYNSWGELYTLTSLPYTVAYRFDSATQTFVSLATTSTYALAPGEAVYVKLTAANSIPYCYSTDFSIPSRALSAGWNLIGGGLTVKTEIATCISIATSGSTAGYTHIISPAENAAAWIYIAGAGSAYDIALGEGYWVFLPIARTLGLFDLTPVAWVPMP